ncbi:uncharacterized protein LOC132726115 [Ruditapes philippinarum]|uniref:uncharacterized protein LOC132726115 n=1 Tax=Ruditapes philippinarum TaxID=129788 RepID=UPI00295B280C|nr:uncharacterized protein LOC132726115 [Ruditapes philippinarum]
MDKSKKLRLKRRIPQQKVRVSTEVDNNVNNVETVTLSSDSEGDGSRPCKQRKLTHTENENVSNPNEKRFLQTDNPSLNRLREMILSLSPRDIDIANLSPFPAFNTQVQGNGNIQEKLSSLCKGRLQPVVKLQSVEELPPFPKLCKHFRKLPNVSKHTNSNEPSLDKVQERVMETSETEIQDKDGSKPSVSFVNDSYNELKASTSYNMCENTSEYKAPASRNIADYREDNSAIIRDRNSNFYSLQSRNTSTKLGDKSRRLVSNTCPSNHSAITQKDCKDMDQKESSSNQVSARTSNSGAGKSNKINLKGPRICDTATQELMPRLHHRNSNLSNLKDNYLDKRSKDNIFPPKKVSTSISKTKTPDKNYLRKGESSSAKPSNEIPQTSSANDCGNVTGAKKENVTLQSCPLCQMKFESRISQMELDSHIAACLSTSEVDVIW